MLPDNKKVRNVKTLVKFRANLENPRSRNRIITNTLGKIGFINQLYRGVLPQDEEFWLVNIDAVITRGTPVSGVFILTPIQVVEREDVDYIMPGMYRCEDDLGIRYVVPTIKGGYWLMSIQDRRQLLEPSIHALIVVSEPSQDLPDAKDVFDDISGMRHVEAPIRVDPKQQFKSAFLQRDADFDQDIPLQ